MGMVSAMAPRPSDPVALWPVVVRTAGVVAVVVAVAAGALSHFAGVGGETLILLSAAVALLAGSRLPAASPRFLQPVDDGDADELAAA
jgi:hypothetical protein